MTDWASASATRCTLLEAKLSAAQAAEEHATATADSATAAANSAAQELDGARLELVALTEQLDSKEAAVQAMAAEVSKPELENAMVKELETRRKQTKALRKEAVEAKAGRDRLREENAMLHMDISNLTSQLTGMLAAGQQRDEEVMRLQSEVEQLEAAPLAETAELKDQLSEALQRQAQLAEDLAAAEDELAQIPLPPAMLGDALAVEESAAMVHANAATRPPKMRAKKSQVPELARRALFEEAGQLVAAKFAGKIGSLQNQVGSISEQLRAESAEKGWLESELLKLQEDTGMLTLSWEAQVAQLKAQAEAEVGQLQEEVAILSEDVEQLQSTNAMQTVARTELERTVSQTKHHLADEQAGADAAHELMANRQRLLQQELDTTKQALEAEQGRTGELKAGLTQLVTNNAQLSEALAGTDADYQSDTSQLHQRWVASEAAAAGLAERLEELESGLTAFVVDVDGAAESLSPADAAACTALLGLETAEAVGSRDWAAVLGVLREKVINATSSAKMQLEESMAREESYLADGHSYIELGRTADSAGPAWSGVVEQLGQLKVLWDNERAKSREFGKSVLTNLEPAPSADVGKTLMRSAKASPQRSPRRGLSEKKMNIFADAAESPVGGKLHKLLNPTGAGGAALEQFENLMQTQDRVMEHMQQIAIVAQTQLELAEAPLDESNLTFRRGSFGPPESPFDVEAHGSFRLEASGTPVGGKPAPTMRGKPGFSPANMAKLQQIAASPSPKKLSALQTLVLAQQKLALARRAAEEVHPASLLENQEQLEQELSSLEKEMADFVPDPNGPRWPTEATLEFTSRSPSALHLKPPRAQSTVPETPTIGALRIHSSPTNDSASSIEETDCNSSAGGDSALGLKMQLDITVKELEQMTALYTQLLDSQLAQSPAPQGQRAELASTPDHEGAGLVGRSLDQSTPEWHTLGKLTPLPEGLFGTAEKIAALKGWARPPHAFGGDGLTPVQRTFEANDVELTGPPPAPLGPEDGYSLNISQAGAEGHEDLADLELTELHQLHTAETSETPGQPPRRALSAVQEQILQHISGLSTAVAEAIAEWNKEAGSPTGQPAADRVATLKANVATLSATFQRRMGGSANAGWSDPLGKFLLQDQSVHRRGFVQPAGLLVAAGLAVADSPAAAAGTPAGRHSQTFHSINSALFNDLSLPAGTPGMAGSLVYPGMGGVSMLLDASAALSEAAAGLQDDGWNPAAFRQSLSLRAAASEVETAEFGTEMSHDGIAAGVFDKHGSGLPATVGFDGARAVSKVAATQEVALAAAHAAADAKVSKEAGRFRELRAALLQAHEDYVRTAAAEKKVIDELTAELIKMQSQLSAANSAGKAKEAQWGAWVRGVFVLCCDAAEDPGLAPGENVPAMMMAVEQFVADHHLEAARTYAVLRRAGIHRAALVEQKAFLANVIRANSAGLSRLAAKSVGLSLAGPQLAPAAPPRPSSVAGRFKAAAKAAVFVTRLTALVHESQA